MATKQKKIKKPNPQRLIDDHRREKFIEMGFTADDAVALSKARDTSTKQLVDSYKVKKILDQGCPPELVVKIFT